MNSRSVLSIIGAIAFLLMSGASQAIDFDFDISPSPNQEDFRSVAEDLTAALNSKSLSPAEPGGLLGFGVGVYASYVETDDPAAWRRLINESVDEVGVVGLIAQKGLPFALDVGAHYSWVPGADVKLFGVDLRYALVEGGIATPAVGLRASYTSLSGIDQLDNDSYGLDLSVSKGFGPLTPYGGIGYVRSEYQADPQFNLMDEEIEEVRYFVGVRLAALLGITPEIERVGDRTAYNLRLGLAF